MTQNNTKEKLIIAIDGYSSCGKSTFAKSIARELGYSFIDSGAMYRAVTLVCTREGWLPPFPPMEELESILNHIDIQFIIDPATGIQETWVNGKNEEASIRDMAIASRVSEISAIRLVREKLVSLQQKMGEKKGIVMDGRDIGTVVFPGADIKIFMTADPDVRAQRRYKELQEKEIKSTFEEVKQNLLERDRMDETRSESPLRKAEDAIVLDNSLMTPEQQMTWFYALFNEKLGKDQPVPCK
jgi:CMP/dCMP kinase